MIHEVKPPANSLKLFVKMCTETEKPVEGDTQVSETNFHFTLFAFYFERFWHSPFGLWKLNIMPCVFAV